MFLFYLSLILKLLMVLLSIAFVTLFERKILSYSQNRVGPNKVMFKGILQPVFDGLKLLMKEFFFPKKMVFWGVLLGPFLGFSVMVILWLIFTPIFSYSKSFYSVVYIVVLIGLSVYSSLVSGWSSTSKFASIGGVRSCSQSVSYEISLVFLILGLLIFFSSVSLDKSSFVFSYWMFFIFWLSCVAETNRAPFDFSEGESELISGFNLEFGSAGFVLLFLAEYGMILFFSFLIASFFLGASSSGFFLVFLSFIFIRSVYPRFRYDMLMKMTWTKFLPLSFSFLLCLFFIL